MRALSLQRARLALALALAPAMVIALGATAVASPGGTWTRPRYANIDCNSPESILHRLKPNIANICADPVHVSQGRYTRFVDDGYYVGHDEPNVRFISNAPGSGHDLTYYLRLPGEPARAPTPSGSITDSGELTVPWFGLELCDPLSYPQQPCTPDSDRNLGGAQRTAAGAALMELQFYPPGYAPFIAGDSCGATWWCGVLTMDSLECSYNMAYCNPNCTEVLNFAFLQTNGVPTGPPSLQGSLDSFIPNARTLRMYPGDVLRVSITDPHRGLTTTVRDLTTGQTGYMVASARNGFVDTRIGDCSTRRWTYHAEYNTARRHNQLPWLAGDGGVVMTQEIGHFDSCSQVLDQQPGSVPATYQTCAGGIEGRGELGPGPCTGEYVQICKNPEAEGVRGPVACPTKRFSFTTLCEFTGSFCVKKGTRPFTINGLKMTQTAPVAYCMPKDLDFDGENYLSRSWPDGSPAHPTPLEMTGPFSDGRTYPVIQFDTSVGGFERLCQVATGRHCQAPPLGAQFYPYWTLSRAPRLAGLRLPSRMCAWEFGHAIRGVTVEALGGDRQYGGPDHGRYLGTLISKPRRNAAVTGACSRRRSG